jgi:hypothetical protein
LIFFSNLLPFIKKILPGVLGLGVGAPQKG